FKMRIITGSAKGIKLSAPRGLGTRPTADRVKEAVFNILGDIVVDAQVLDIFAGTGNLGLEALSRGASAAVFIDSSIDSITSIKENAQRTKLIGQVEILKNDVIRALDRFAGTGRSFDLIFCDPPYNKGLVQKVLEKIETNAIVNPKGILVIEHSKHEEIKNQWDHLQLRRVEKYGETLISFLLYNTNQEVR
ncbi:MAG: methyltransferase, partial [Firmicutes bacterium]|nr:methyltransferase [Bacillota bacterium]